MHRIKCMFLLLKIASWHWGMGSIETIPWISCKLEQEHLPMSVLLCGGHAVSSPPRVFLVNISPNGTVNTCPLSLQFLVQTVL